MGRFVVQGLAAFIASLGMCSAGMFVGWATPSLPKLLESSLTESGEDKDELQLTDEEGSWLVSITSIGAMFGPIFSSLVVDRLGRRWSLMLIVFPFLISWIIIGIATSVDMLYAGRFVGGLSLGASYAVMPMYLGEIAEDKIRGSIATFGPIALLTGMLASSCIGPWVSRPIFSIVSAVPSLMFIILFFWLPETPYYYLMKGAREKATTSLTWLRGGSDVNVELSSMEAMVIDQRKNRNDSEIATLFRTASNRKAFGIVLGLLTFQQVSGAIVIFSYASIIFEDSGLTGWSRYSVVITGIVNLVSGIGGIILIDVVGRRPLLFVTGTCLSISLLSEAIFFHFQYLGYDTKPYAVTPLLGVVGFYLFFGPGFGSIPHVMASELFPTNVKAASNTLLAMYGSLLGFVISKAYQSISSLIGVHWLFYFFSAIMFVSIFFVYFCVPETKNLSLENIQNNLKSQSFGHSGVKSSRDTALPKL